MSTEDKKILKYQQKLEKYETKIDSINLKIKDCEEECGIEILDMSFMITHVEDRNKEWEDFY